MKRTHGRYEFETLGVEDREEGWAGLDLYCAVGGKRERVASLVYWDASGEFTIEMFERLVPLVIIEELIREAKATIRTA
jgi:hypothetical protein